MKREEVKYLNAFNQFQLLGPQGLKKIKNFFGSYQKAWKAPSSLFIKAGIKGKLLQELDQKRRLIEPDKELQKLQKAGIGIVSLGDKDYPQLLSEIYDAPPIFYYLGNKELLNLSSFAVVGTRRPSSYGKELVEYFVPPLAQAGLVIVSGLARGIDALAHSSALQVGGLTAAVLGCGLDRIYPASNRNLAKKILQKKGLIISEYPLGTPPLRHHFPVRNRLISGLSLGVLVIEAANKSGTLLTAAHALEQGREIFAVPGNIFSSRSQGCNNLIQSGAFPVSSPEQILEELRLKKIKISPFSEKLKIPAEEKLILQALQELPLPVDKIIKKTKLPASQINILLTKMEIQGKIKHLGGGVYGLKRSAIKNLES